MRSATVNERERHGHATLAGNTKTYECWRNMRRRCRDPRNKRFAQYGGRGITVCERWELFSNFLADMGERPAGMTIDRKDNDGNYEPGNCRWATAQEQSRHRTSTIMVCIDGVSKCLAEWAVDFGADYNNARRRIQNFGWNPTRALLTPTLRRGRLPKIKEAA